MNQEKRNTNEQLNQMYKDINHVEFNGNVNEFDNYLMIDFIKGILEYYDIFKYRNLNSYSLSMISDCFNRDQKYLTDEMVKTTFDLFNKISNYKGLKKKHILNIFNNNEIAKSYLNTMYDFKNNRFEFVSPDELYVIRQETPTLNSKKYLIYLEEEETIFILIKY